MLCKFRIIAIGPILLLDENWPIETILNFSLCVTMVPKVTSIDSTYFKLRPRVNLPIGTVLSSCPFVGETSPLGDRFLCNARSAI